MNLAEYAISKKTVTLVLTVLTFVAGAMAFMDLGRLEDPEFTVKTAVISTMYTGASPQEVETEVTQKLEKTIQQLKQLKDVRSLSQAGMSIIWVEIQPQYAGAELAQIWDELRRKVNDATPTLPPGAGTPNVNDDFGDVYGVFFAVTGEGYSYKELKDYVDLLRRELLLVDGVAKIVLWGEQPEAVFVEVSRARMAQLGVSMEQVFQTLNARNLVADAGRVRLGDEYVRIDPTGLFESVDEVGELLIAGGAQGGMLRLKDIATVSRGYMDPPRQLMRFNGEPAIGIGISTVPGGNVVEMGKAVRARLAELEVDTPVGMKRNVVSFQGESVEEAVNGFLLNLAEALAIVIGVLLLTMGLRSGLIIGAGLLQTVAITFIFMALFDINLQRISLGALILALGMLVDNAIVVTEGILIKMQQGMDRMKAASKTVADTTWPLLGATVVAVLAFAAIGTSDDATGEFCGSLFQVLMISLSASWLQAVTVTPLLCHRYLKVKEGSEQNDPYGHPVFRFYRIFLDRCMRHRAATVIALLMVLGGALWGFGFVEHSFFPDSTRPQFYVDFWRPEGSHIQATAKDMEAIEKYLLEQEEVTDVTTTVGEGAVRFMLTYEPEMPNTSYGMLLVSVKDYTSIPKLVPRVQRWIDERYPDADPKVKPFVFGPPDKAKIEARFKGPDADVLRSLAEQAKDIMRADADSRFVRDDWRQRVKTLRPQFSELMARRTGLTRPNLAQAIQSSFSGTAVGVYREGDDLLPIIARAPETERGDAGNIRDVQVWSAALGQAVPIGQVAPEVETVHEDPLIHRRDRKRTITAQCDPGDGTAAALLARIRPSIEAIELPQGYELEWGGEYKSSAEAQEPLAKMTPIYLVAMFIITVMLFNALRQPVIIFLCLPLAIIGVTAGLVATGQPMGFMAILGFLSLAGMLIKNAIVLIDQIDMEIGSGKRPYLAILESSVSRVRPVCMAAVTTILGMIPLLPDAFFASMAVTIMGGLAFATVLTLVVVPVLYALFFRVRPQPEQG